MTAQEAYILAKAYTNKSIEGAGSLKGAACQIKSIEAITGGHRITFEWEDNDGEVSTDTMDVMDGADGNDGVGISSITYKETDAHGNYVYTVTLTDTNTYDIICPKGAQGETGATGATGNGIASIEKTSTAGLVDTYTITYTNGQTTTFTVTNGESITVDSAMSGSSTNPVQNKVITEALALKQNAEDNNLTTTSKTVVGAVNELKSGLTTLDNEVNGDATVYPYADVITIPDAVPSNLADCNVKIDPVQDLHGYDKPWVGGAGKNKFDPALIVNPISSVKWVQVSLKANTAYTVSSNIPYNSTSAYIFAIAGTDTSNVTSGTNGVGLNRPQYITTGSDGIISFGYRTNGASGSLNLDNYTYQIEEGSTTTDYAPYENICPITGHTEASVQRDGKNLFNEENANWKSNYYIDENGQEVESLQYKYTQTYIPVEGGSSYALSIDKTTTNNVSTFISLYNKNKDIVGYSVVIDATSETKRVAGSITLNSNVAYVRINTYKNGAQNIQLELGSTATPYEPYQGKTYTLALGDTIYGGTVDFDSGVMTVYQKYAKGFTRGSLDSTGKLYGLGTIADIKSISSVGGVADLISNMYDVDSMTHIRDASVTPKKLAQYQTALYIGGYVGDETALDAILPDLEICYELATPTTIQLTPQQIQLLKGTNTLTASTGQISVTVNGVSGAIGAVQEQVNDHEERIEALESGGGSDDYTNTEQVVGTWMGETLYRKSYYNPSYSSGDVDFNISNIKAVIKIEGMAQIRFVENDYDSFIPIPYINGNVNAENKFQQGPATQTGKIVMNIGSNYTPLLPVKLYMTMYYTKSTT